MAPFKLHNKVIYVNSQPHHIYVYIYKLRVKMSFTTLGMYFCHVTAMILMKFCIESSLLCNMLSNNSSIFKPVKTALY